jgi:lipoate synthase
MGALNIYIVLVGVDDYDDLPNVTVARHFAETVIKIKQEFPSTLVVCRVFNWRLWWGSRHGRSH